MVLTRVRCGKRVEERLRAFLGFYMSGLLPLSKEIENEKEKGKSLF